MIDRDIRFSLVAGGPFYEVLRTARLVEPDRFLPLRPAIAVVMITWLPLVAIALARRVATGAFDPIMEDLSLHVRMLVAIPLFFVAESSLELHGDLATKRFERGSFAADEPDAFARAIARAQRMRDRIGPELVLALATFGASLATLADTGLPAGWVHASVHDRNVPSVLLWYGLFVIPLFQFLLGRWLWRWLIWTVLLFEISRVRLRLMPTHPDHGGGIVHLSSPIAAFALFSAALSAVVSAVWFTNVLLQHAHATKFVPALCLFVIVAEAVAFTPLLAFARNLNHARRKGLTEYGLLALHLTRVFNKRWIERPADDTILDRSDVSELTDLMSAHAGLVQMRVFPFNPRAALWVAAAVLVPMLPLVGTVVPFHELLMKVVQAVLT